MKNLPQWFLRSVWGANVLEVMLALTVIIGFIVCLFIFTYIYFVKDLQTKDAIMNRNDTGVTLFDRNNKPFFTFYNAKQKTFVTLSDIPLYTQHAVIAMEDKDFYFHTGFSIKAMIRSLYLNITEGAIAYGGSTITQQLVKNSLLHSKKSFLRKFQEIVLAEEIERRYTKNEILEMYLNSAYFGEGAFGIAEAAQRYFGKVTKDLTLGESALLVGLLPSPSRFSPLSGDLSKARLNQKIVLKKMLEQKYITIQEKVNAENEKMIFSPYQDMNSLAPHFAIMVKNELLNKFGQETISRSGFKVKTTLDPKIQHYAENTIKTHVKKLQSHSVTNGAAIMITPTNGEVIALVGSMNWYDFRFGKVNVTTSYRQPGSAFKPIVYLAGFELHIITPATFLSDEPTVFDGDYKPQNFDRMFRGNVSVRTALANSLNIPSVKILDKVGILTTLDMAKRLGITNLTQHESAYGLSLVLGSEEVQLLELTSAYATIANNGIRNTPTLVLEIKDKKNNPVYTYVPKQEQVVNPEYTFLVSSILSDKTARLDAFGSALDTTINAAVKTGTSENFRDSLTIGYSPDIAVGVWVGNNYGESMDNIAGALGAAPIWKSLIEYYHKQIPYKEFPLPENIIQVSVCKHNGLRAFLATSSAMLEYFVRGTEPQQPCFVTYSITR